MNITTPSIKFSGICLFEFSPAYEYSPAKFAIQIEPVRTTYDPFNGQAILHTKKDELRLITDPLASVKDGEISVRNRCIKDFMNWLLKGEGRTASKQEVFTQLSTLLTQLTSKHAQLGEYLPPYIELLQTPKEVALHDSPNLLSRLYYAIRRGEKRQELPLGELTKRSNYVTLLQQ